MLSHSPPIPFCTPAAGSSHSVVAQAAALALPSCAGTTSSSSSSSSAFPRLLAKGMCQEGCFQRGNCVTQQSVPLEMTWPSLYCCTREQRRGVSTSVWAGENGEQMRAWKLSWKHTILFCPHPLPLGINDQMYHLRTKLNCCERKEGGAWGPWPSPEKCKGCIRSCMGDRCQSCVGRTLGCPSNHSRELQRTWVFSVRCWMGAVCCWHSA